MSSRHLCGEVLDDYGLGVDKLLSHVPVLLGPNLHWDLLGTVCWVLEPALQGDVLWYVGHQPSQVNLESQSCCPRQVFKA